MATTKAGYVDWDDQSYEGVTAWSSGNVLLDWLTTVEGLPKGRIVETYGPESSGKTSLAMQTASHVWNTLGIPSHFADFEDAFDSTYARALGLNAQGLRLYDPPTIETLEDFLEALIDSLQPAKFAKAPFALVIVDSVAACRCRSEMESGAADLRTIGMEKARIWSDNLRKLLPLLAATNVTLVLVNQIRDNIDISGAFVPPGVAAMRPKTRTPGGRGIKFYASLRIEYEVSSDIKEERYDPVLNDVRKQTVGKHVWLRVTKNKVGPPPWRQTRLQIRDGVGFDLAQNLLDFAVVHQIVQRERGVYTFPGTLSGNGEPFTIAASGGFSGDLVAAELLRQRPGIREALTAMVMERLNTSAEYVADRPAVPDPMDEEPLPPVPAEITTQPQEPTP